MRNLSQYIADIRTGFYPVLIFFCLAATVAAEWAVVALPVADVRSASGSLPSSQEYDPLQETQLLYGETVEVLEQSGDWLRIEAPEQQEYSHGNVWRGYPGWIKKEAVVSVKKPPFLNFVVKKKSARLLPSTGSKKAILTLSMGTRLNCTGAVKNGFWKVKTVTGKTAWIAQDDTRLLTPPLPQEFMRKMVVEFACEFLGDLYFWGGRSAHLPELPGQVTAVDCSGLVNLAYRTAGVEVPRDSLEQYMKSRKIGKEELQAGDLVFSASKENPAKVTHVAIFLDEKTILEAPKTGERVRKIGFEEKYGLPLEKVLEGEPVGERFLYFGTFF